MLNINYKKQSNILNAAKVIVNFKFPENNHQSYTLDLHDNFNSIKIDLQNNRVHIAEGRGRNRVRNILTSFDNIAYFNATEISLGHNCINHLVDEKSVGGRKLINDYQIFTPISIDLVFKNYWIHNLGVTATPLLIPVVRGTGLEEFLKSTDDCVRLCEKAIKWIAEVNVILRNKEVE